MMLLAGRHWLQAGRKYPLLIGLWPSMAWDYRMDMLNLVYDSCAVQIPIKRNALCVP